MKFRTKKYINRKKAWNNLHTFSDLKSFLMAGLALSRSMVVKKDIIETMIALEQPADARLAYAS